MTDIELKKALQGIEWPIQYGTVTVQIKDGKPVIAKVERTIKMD